VSLRGKIVTYLVLIHFIWAGVAVFVFFDNRVWLLAVEVFFVISIVCGVLLMKSFFVPLELIRTGAELIKERDFTCKFVEVGQTEMDQLIQVYNRMIDALREERTRLTEQHYFLGKVLAASPSGILTLDYDGRIALVNPSAARLLQSGSQALEGRTLAEVGSSLAGTLIDLAPGESRVIPFHGSRRLKCRRSQFLDRGFARASRGQQLHRGYSFLAGVLLQLRGTVGRG
jgi:signal transduction histidine kinase